ncbi:hypothetical protein [Paeniglutamicibacter sp.]|uniref:hypothetical protein n=1 Tax=Paeniglutamicibacter sp. TaxID=1934391 RepID=UPI00398A4332
MDEMSGLAAGSNVGGISASQFQGTETPESGSHSVLNLVRQRMDHGPMRIELLHIAECPNSAEAGLRLEMALTALGHSDIGYRTRLLESQADAVGTAFAGSPTITVDGTDIFPNGAPTSDLACRIYMNPGGIAGLPTVEQLKEAFRDNGL